MDEAQVAVEQVAPEPAVEVQSPEVPVEAGAETKVETPPPVQEKMIPASHVSKIAAREAKQAAERARQETLAEFQKQQVQQDTAPQTPSSMGGIPQISPEQMEQHIMAAAHRMSTQMTANKMAQDFEAKINAEIQEDPDFGDLYDKMNIAQHPELVIWMNGMDNSAKVVKDLAQNPAKFANILMLAKSGLGDLAQSELTKLSTSIKTNLAAQAQPKAKEPLDQLSPSSVGVDSGSMSVSDFQKMDWLRG
jgi:hypothetical protein